MLIEQIPIRNSLKNYMYLLACKKTHEAIAIDPLDHALCLKVAKKKGWTIKTVANTHHHHDHIGGNKELLHIYKSKLIKGSGIDISRFRSNKKTSSEDFIFLYVGRLLKEKGINEYIESPNNSKDICTPCEKPCLTACPVSALNQDGYDVIRCKEYVKTPSGQECRNGCLVRRSCPSGQNLRLKEQSNFHMRAFLSD